MINSCPLCGSKENEIYLIKDFENSNSVNILNCKKCKHKFQQNYSVSYEDEYYSYYEKLKNKKKNEIFNKENKLNYKKIFKKFENHIIKFNLKKNILDIGSGYGELVNYANENQWNALGVELSKEAVKIAEKFKINVKNININDNYFNQKKFSIIILTEVIEHLDNPNALVNNIIDLLHKDGILYITTPNFNSIDRYIMSSEWHVIHKEHINYFTKKSLNNYLLSFNKFDIIEKRSYNIIFEIYKIKLKRLFFLKSDKKNIYKSNLELRKKINNNYFLTILKILLNYLLNLFQIGNSLTFILKKK